MDLPDSNELRRQLDKAQDAVRIAVTTLEAAQTPRRDPSVAGMHFIDGNVVKGAESRLSSAEHMAKVATERVGLGERRDRILAGRPEECFCLGSGEPHPRERDEENHPRWCSCPEGQERQRLYDAEQDRKLQARIETALEEVWCVDSDIPLRFINCEFGTAPKGLGAIIKRLTPEDKDLFYTDSWYLWGAYGVGKTGLAVSYAYEYARHITRLGYKGTGLRFIRTPDLLTRLRSTYRKRQRDDDDEAPETEGDVLDLYSGPGLLILDDIGAEQITGSGWVEDRLYQIIGARHDECRPTVFTSNLSLEQMAARIGERLTWRIAEMCGPGHIVEVKGQNLRDWRKATS